jgi:hypothetical protein
MMQAIVFDRALEGLWGKVTLRTSRSFFTPAASAIWTFLF